MFLILMLTLHYSAFHNDALLLVHPVGKFIEYGLNRLCVIVKLRTKPSIMDVLRQREGGAKWSNFALSNE